MSNERKFLLKSCPFAVRSSAEEISKLRRAYIVQVFRNESRMEITPADPIAEVITVTPVKASPVSIASVKVSSSPAATTTTTTTAATTTTTTTAATRLNAATSLNLLKDTVANPNKYHVIRGANAKFNFKYTNFRSICFLSSSPMRILTIFTNVGYEVYFKEVGQQNQQNQQSISPFELRAHAVLTDIADRLPRTAFYREAIFLPDVLRPDQYDSPFDSLGHIGDKVVAIELDGQHHFDPNNQGKLKQDRIKELRLNLANVYFLRIHGDDVNPSAQMIIWQFLYRVLLSPTPFTMFSRVQEYDRMRMVSPPNGRYYEYFDASNPAPSSWLNTPPAASPAVARCPAAQWNVDPASSGWLQY